MATRKFNIDDVLAGAKIVQRSGELAKFLLYVPESVDEDNVIWLDENNQIQFSHPENGNYYGIETESPRDLFIWEPEPKKIVQLKTGEVHIGFEDYQGIWQDTNWTDIRTVRQSFPNEKYREVTVGV